jgi:hypothetical protein
MSRFATSRRRAAGPESVDHRAQGDQRIALEIHLGDEALHEGFAEDREVDMGRAASRWPLLRNG